ncbi:MAG: recombinase family protein [Bacteroidaceae bacterium]|nr:recombinase family protein [Bacteroidaceae bacterium]
MSTIEKKLALYVRASTDKQEETVEAQTNLLKAYAADTGQDYMLYVDEDISGQKANRVQYNKLLNDVDAGLISKICFTKLDRWFRNLAEYSNTNEFLKQRGVKWSAILEPHFSTDSAMSEAITNIVMSIAQLEAKQIGERIDVVFANKVSKGEVLFGAQCLPFGYTTRDKRVIKDPALAPIVEDIFDYFQYRSNSVRGTKLYIEAKYNISLHYNTISRMFKNELYYGAYRDNKNYVEDPYMTYERWEIIQSLVNKNARKRKNNRIYVFSGLIVCDECRTIHSGKTVKRKKVNEYPYYRCNQAYLHNRCGNRTSLSELKIETYLLENLHALLEAEIESVEAAVTDAERQEMINNEKSIRRKQARLKEMYMEDFFTMEEFKQKHAELEAQIVRPPRHGKKDLQEIKNLIEGDVLAVYETLDREEKRALWRGIIESIEIRRGKIVGVNFL